MLLSIVVPSYNEEAVLEELHRRDSVLDRRRYGFEFSNYDCRATDAKFLSRCKHATLACALCRYRVTSLEKTIAVPAGLSMPMVCRCIIDSDLQDPPEVSRRGQTLARGLRSYTPSSQARGETTFKLMTRRLFTAHQ